MPIYEYQCEKCLHEFQREQRITADPIKTCPECKARRVKKLISQTSFVLEGGGWYNDLYSSTKKHDKSTSTDASEGKSESKDSKPSDSKDSSESKSDSKSDSKPKKKSSKNKPSKSAA